MMLVHIDTDMGVDDALALTVAARLLGLRVVALSTVFGNVPLSIATRNARLMRRMLDPALAVPVLAGAECPLVAPPANAAAVHGDDGLGGATATVAAQMLNDVGQPGPGDGMLADFTKAGPPGWIGDGDRVTLVGLGPATNIPALARWYGAALDGIVLMSGAFFDQGNITAAAEFNAYCDPEALREVLSLGVPVRFVPLDLCRKVQLSRATSKAWADLEPRQSMQFLSVAHMRYMDWYQRAEAIDGCFPHDAITILAACFPTRFFEVPGIVDVVDNGVLRGRTCIVAGASNVSVLTGGDLRWLRKGLSDLCFDA